MYKLSLKLALALLAFTFVSAASANATNENASPVEQEAANTSALPQPKSIDALPLEELRIFTKIYSNVRASYIEEIDDATLLEYAIKGILSELDPHSVYLDANKYDNLQVQTSGEFGGLGIEIGMEDGYVKVITPIDDTPAAEAGIEAGDLITKIDGDSVKGMTLNESIDKMRGDKGTQITVTVVREGVELPFDVELTRDVIKVRSVRSGVRDDYYGYIRIAQFQLNTGDDVISAFGKLKEASPDLRGLIIDLRNNPGGVLAAAIDVSDAFLDSGKIVYTEGRLKGSDRQYFAKEGDISNGLPIVVLINDGSASASEIVAGALQDQGRALILGTRSFGKGSVQSVIPVTDDRGVKLTTALYYTPKGRSIQAQGIEPDITVERVRVTAVRPRSQVTEADLKGHLKNRNGGEERGADSREMADTELLNRDSQLYEALNLLKGLSLFRDKMPNTAIEPASATKAIREPAVEPEAKRRTGAG